MCRRPEELAQATSPWGLSRHEASRRLIYAVESEVRREELTAAPAAEAAGASRLAVCPRLAARLPGTLQYFIGTEDGLLASLCVLVIVALFVLPPLRAGRHTLRLRTPLWYSALWLLFLAGNAWTYYVMRRVEKIRAVSQLKEAVAQYKTSLHREYMAAKHHSQQRPQLDASVCELAVPSTTLVSVLREGEWTRVPFNLVVYGDTFKLRRGDVAPSDAIRVKLRSAFRTHDQDLPDSYSLVCVKGKEICQGAVFEEDIGMFVSTDTPAVQQVSQFLKSAAAARRLRSAPFSDSLAAPYVNNAELVYVWMLRPVMWGSLVLSLAIVLLRFFLTLKVDGIDAFPLYPQTAARDFLLTPLVLFMLYNPMIVRFIDHLCDIWANARLQSLFLFHNERMYHSTAHDDDDASHDSNASPQEDDSMMDSNGFSSEPSVFSDTGFSRPSSVHSDVSVSRVPFRKQLQELVSVYRQGLDGSTNLLHALASTTYLCFIDQESLLTDSCGSLKEICVFENQTTSPPRASSSAGKRTPRARVAFNDVVEEIEPSIENDSLEPQHKTLNRRGASTIGSDVFNEVGGLISSDFKLHTLQLTTTAFDEGFYEVGADRRSGLKQHDPTGSCRISRSECGSTWMRFVDELQAQQLQPNLLSLALGMKLTQAPPIPKMLGASVGWLHTQRLHDVFQRMDWEWNTCLCTASELLESHDVVEQFTAIRHIMLLSNAQHKDVKTPAGDHICQQPVRRNWCRVAFEDENDSQTLVQDELTLPDVPCHAVDDIELSPLLYSVLARDSRDDTVHLFTKGAPEAVLDECQWFFDGQTLVTMTPDIRTKLDSLLVQWKSEGYLVYGLAYGQVPESVSDYLLQALEEYTMLTTMEEDGTYKWQPMIAHPGPRSIFRRPEPFVFPNNLEQSATNASYEPTYKYLDYDNSLVTTPYRAFKADGGSSGSRERPSDQLLELYHRVAWLPHKCQVRGANMLRSLVSKNLVLMGLIALRLNSPSGVPRRINDFHSAGVRFSVFSPHNMRETRHLGELLGLETGWNCLISLRDEDENFVNQEGNQVLPSGINSIRKHVRDVDNVPLLVSLYANSSPKTVLQFIKLLQSQNEVVTVVGSALKTSNFDIFKIASCPISILPIPYQLCTKCHNRRPGADSQNDPRKEEARVPPPFGGISVGRCVYMPRLLPEYSFSAALNSLPCALQSHSVSFSTNLKSVLVDESSDNSSAEFLLQLLYSIFQEARRLITGIQAAIALCVLINGIYVGGLLLARVLLNVPPILDIPDVFLFLTLYVPLLSFVMVSNPPRPSLMTTLPSNILPENKPNQLAFKNGCSVIVKKGVVLQAAKMGVPIVCTVGASVWLFIDMIERASGGVCRVYNPFGRWWACFGQLSSVGADQLLLIHGQVGVVLVLTHLLPVTLCQVSRYDSIFAFNPFRNKWVPIAFLAITAVAVLKFGLLVRTIPRPVWHACWAPPWTWWCFVALAPFLSLLACEIIAYWDRQRHERRQKFLKLFFHTRLGMWSPK